MAIRAPISIEKRKGRMKIILSVLAICGCLISAAAQDTKQSVETLNWIAGCWEMTRGTTVTTERWAKPTENLMLGTSQTVKAGKSVSFEFLRIVNNGHGLTYVAQPSDAKAPTAFAAIKVTATEIVFENAKHDFPQRIIYRSEKPDSLFARIEGMQGEKLQGMDFPMKRVKCE
jgi:hypothetical protein